MSIADPAAEYLRLAEHYRRMKDEELLELIPQRDNLTPAAQETLATEVRHRGLKIEAVEENPAPAPLKPPTKFNPPSFTSPEPKFREGKSFNSISDERSHDFLNNGANEGEAEEEIEDPYEEERKLVTISTVWSLRDALKMQRVLDVAGIPFYMGKEKATGVEQVKSDFSKGVDVQIMSVGWPWANDAMKRDYFPEDEPPSEESKDPKPLMVRCPQCQSNDVVFRGLAPVVGVSAEDSPRKFLWTCDRCGNEWGDEGMGKE